MQNKEEIEIDLKALSGVMLNFEDRLCDEMQERVKRVKEYIAQLETSKQKLIDKLEEIIKETSKNISPETMKKYQNVEMDKISDETYILLALHRIGLAGKILEIVKGEKNNEQSVHRNRRGL